MEMTNNKKGEKGLSAYVSKYSWKSGYNYKKSADVVGKVLTEIEERDGSVTSKSFLEYSRPEDSETHDMFEWDDTIAAEKYRLAQSGRIINQLQIEVVYSEDSSPREVEVEVNRAERFKMVSAFVNVVPKTVKGSAVFTNTLSALRDKEKRVQVLKNALAELESFKARYESLEELSGVMDAIKDLKATVNDVA